MIHSTFSLRNSLGYRKYLTSEERNQFYQVIKKYSVEQQLFLQMLFWTGGRISEILNLRITQIDTKEKLVIIRSLKKRTDLHFREIPLPAKFIFQLSNYIKALDQKTSPKTKLWTWSRRTASRYVKSAMSHAKIEGIHACAKGLRHSFAVHCVLSNIPLTTVQKWMGHSHISTTAIYTNVMGKEERKLASRMWNCS